MRIYFLILSFLISAPGISQTTPNYLYGRDVIITTRDTSSAELTIRNNTRNVLGYFKNIGGGKGRYTLIPQIDVTGLPDSLLARYTKTQSDARYKPIGYFPSWAEITGIPANFTTTYALSNDVRDSVQSRVNTFGRQIIGGPKTFTDTFQATSPFNYFGKNNDDGYLFLRGWNGSTARFIAQTGVSLNYNGLLISSNPDNNNSLPRWDLDLGGNDNPIFGNSDGFNLRRKATSGSPFTSLFRVDSSGNATANSFVRVGGLSTQYQMADGSVSTLTNPVTGTGVNGRVSFWNSTNTIGSDGLFFWDNTNKKLALGTSSTSSATRLIIQGTAGSDGGQLGSELLTTGSSDASWTGSSFATGYTHVSGSVTTLTSSVAAVNLSSYQITFTVTGRTAGTFTISFGGYTSGNLSATGNVGPRATSTASLVVTPTTDFDGTIVLSIREVTTSTPTASFLNSAGSLVTNEIRAFSTASNVGYGTGVLGRVTTGLLNTGFGQNVLPRLTTGTGNTGGGATTMLALTIGLNNTGFGTSVLTNNISGSQNAGFGESAISSHTNPSGIAAFGRGVFSSLTSGSNDVGIGTNSFLNLVSGSDLVSVGHNAGRFISGGSVSTTIANSSIFIGSETRPLADNQSNQIVIGHNVTGLGSNTISIGNLSTLLSSIRGRLLVNGAVDDGASGLRVTGSGLFSSTLTSTQFRLSALNTAPSSATDTGTLGEIRITDGFIHIATGTNTWRRVAIATW